MRLALIKASVVLAPSYAAAALTDKMVYVVPTLAAAGFVAAAIDENTFRITRRVEEDEDGADASDLVDHLQDTTETSTDIDGSN